MSEFTVADLTEALAPGGPGPSQQWARRCAALLGMAGVAVSARIDGPELLWFSDESSAALDDLQFTLGEGPGVEAALSGALCLVGDLELAPGPRWPAFVPGALGLGVRAVFAFPLRLGGIRLGALTGHRRTTRPPVDEEMVAAALTISDALAVCLLMSTTDPKHPGQLPGIVDDLHRAEVHQATGMLSEQLNVSLATALDRLRAHAFATNRPITEVAHDLVTRRLRLRF
ncbi:GAF and ANTAR domain-containing protein [Streptomyces daliensis]|uniref:GAF and ANTAR domain-containing protein n=1 Tax=Streptomyces daliensis TaxID=299421 RepID=A0A8T4INI2_9ACTN|nr:GAF and ANTAR domain-containing protein [Streptomyces daliensis]